MRGDACNLHGRAAEHLVVADLLLGGYRAFLAEPTLPYDVVADIAGRLVRIQVKAAFRAGLAPSEIQASRKTARYMFNVRKHRTLERLTAADADVVAFVALDERLVSYETLAQLTATSGDCPTCVAYTLNGNGRSFANRTTARDLRCLVA